jgi:hypothetical protein
MHHSRFQCGLILAGLTLALSGCDGVVPGAFEGEAGDKQDTVPQLLEGFYLLDILSLSTMQDRETKERYQKQTRLIALTQIEQTGAQWSMTLNPCRFDLPQLGPFTPKFLKATIAHLPPMMVTGAIQTQAEGAVSLSSEPFAFTMGLRLKDTLHDPLPQQKNSSAVIDQDQDGEAGVTVQVAGFQVYLAIRITATMQGLFQQQAESGSPMVVGDLDLSMDLAVYGDTIPFYNAAESAKNAESTVEVLTSKHSFTLIPALAKTSCDRPPQ